MFCSAYYGLTAWFATVWQFLLISQWNYIYNCIACNFLIKNFSLLFYLQIVFLFYSVKTHSLYDVLVSSRWSRREEAEFYRLVSAFGVERNPATGDFKWERFRSLGHLDRKYDDTLAEYFRAFYHMCKKVCRRFANEDEGLDCYVFIINDFCFWVSDSQVHLPKNCLFVFVCVCFVLFLALFSSEKRRLCIRRVRPSVRPSVS